MNLDYLELEDDELESAPVRREKVRSRPRDEEESRGRKDRRRERIRQIRKSHTRY